MRWSRWCIVLEATRRVLGLALPLTAIAFLVYAVGFTQRDARVLMEQLYLSTEGIFGSTLGVSASYVMLFVLFGAFMEKSGTGQLFMDFAMSITGHTAGGPARSRSCRRACSARCRAARSPT